MKKNEYIYPEMEIVEMTGQCAILAGSDDGTTAGGNGTGRPGGKVAGTGFDD